MSQQIFHAQSMYELRKGPCPSYAQLDGTELEFKIQRAKKVIIQRQHARLVMVPPNQAGSNIHYVPSCEDNGNTRK